MLGQQFATILARTDPFDVAQGLERHIRMLNGAEIRLLIQAAAPRMNDWYRSEFLPLLNEDDDHLRAAFAHSLKSNLRAIPLFGPNFCEGVIAKIPGDRTVGLGEEGNRRVRARPLAFAIVAVALLIGGAAAEHVFATARANANTPVVLMTPEPAAPAASARPRASSPPKAASAPPRATPAPAPAIAQVQSQIPAAQAQAPAPAQAAQPATAPPAPRPRRTPPPGSGVKTVVAQEPRRTPSPEPTQVDTSDMPQAYSDATPLPGDATPAPAQLNTSGVKVNTPTPAPNRYWLHSTVRGTLRTLNNLNPFKHKGPEPTASPNNGPQQQ